MWTVDLGLIEAWLMNLDDDTYDQVIAAIELLQEHGPQLGRPLVDTVKGSSYKNMKELRPGSSGKSELRVLFAFDPQRQAIVLVAGDKAGNWKTWYRENMPIADARFTEHLAQMKKQTEKDKTKRK
ncbi:type II toxin-antitoxin system RelE/ParE family toxin [Cnuibacter physcomitrellae]|uniref:type II toxin-antitoxin system RelE/ParE family toxin n=1 Tax=Cnuibacter physcomitrellae TaxID=1619308 RepID=UPI002175FCAB|nr:type II toxin-antitoxin system RelE/ParE family toxin [Cnuibacter physcomitrellae]MCS5496423.1 type II toxin-antitoxin system RelE/ParE family toxin [Cnuibacter physcomitrellae]